MKKVLSLALVLLASLAGRSQAQTYLLDIYTETGNQYSGNAATDFGLTGTVVDVGGSESLSGGGNNLTSDVFTLGSVGTLTLAAPFGTYNLGIGSDSTTAGHLTKAYTFVDSFLPETSNTFTLDLTGLPVGDTVSIAAIGAANNSATRSVISLNGGTGVLIAGASSTDGTGAFTEIASGLTSGTYTLVQTSHHDSAYEGDLSGFAITVAAAPEPSTWALLFAGMGGLAFLMRRRARQNS